MGAGFWGTATKKTEDFSPFPARPAKKEAQNPILLITASKSGALTTLRLTAVCGVEL